MPTSRTTGYNMIEWQYLFAASIFAIIPVVILFMCIEKNLVINGGGLLHFGGYAHEGAP